MPFEDIWLPSAQEMLDAGGGALGAGIGAAEACGGEGGWAVNGPGPAGHAVQPVMLSNCPSLSTFYP